MTKNRSAMAMPTTLPEGWTVRKKVEKKRSVTTQLYGTADYRVVSADGAYVAVLFASRVEPAMPAKGSDRFKPGDVWQITTVDSTTPGSGWGAYVRQEFARDVSAAGGYVVSDTNLSQSGQRFWDKLHQNTEVHREPFPRQIQRNYVDDPSKPRGTQEWLAEPPESTQYKYRLASLRQAMPMLSQLPDNMYATVVLIVDQSQKGFWGKLSDPDGSSIADFYSKARSATPAAIDGLRHIDLLIGVDWPESIRGQLAVGKGNGASRAFYVSFIKNSSGVRGLGAWLRMEALRMVSALGGTLESDGSVSESAQTFWTKLYQDPNVQREPRIELASMPGEKFKIQRNTLDKPPEQRTPQHGDGKRLPKSKNPELYHKYRLASLGRRAGRFELPPGVLEHVWSEVESTVREFEKPGAQGHRFFNFSVSLFAKSNLPRMHEYATGGSFVVLIRTPPADEASNRGGFYNPNTMSVVINVRRGGGDYAKSVLAHELLHLQQDLFSRAHYRYKMDWGNPGKNKKIMPILAPGESMYRKPGTDGSYGVSLTPETPTDPVSARRVLPHADRQVEFYTNLESNIHEFNTFMEEYRSMSSTPWSSTWSSKPWAMKDYIKAFIDAGNLRITDANKARQEKYVREFVRAVTKAHGADGFREDWLTKRGPEKVLNAKRFKEAYAEAVRSIDPRQVMQLLIAVFVANREAVGHYAEQHKEPEVTNIKGFIKKIDPSWAAMLAENDYDIYKQHVVNLPKPKVEDRDPEPISTTDAIAELQRRFREADAKPRRTTKPRTTKPRRTIPE